MTHAQLLLTYSLLISMLYIHYNYALKLVLLYIFIIYGIIKDGAQKPFLFNSYFMVCFLLKKL